MKIQIASTNHDFSEPAILGGEVWLNNLRLGFQELGHEAKFIGLQDSAKGDVLLFQSEWAESETVKNFKGRKICLLGHFIKGVYPDPHKIDATMVTVWKGHNVAGFDAHFVPHAYSKGIDEQPAVDSGGKIIWAGNTYALRDEGWLEGLEVQELKGILPWNVSQWYKGNVCPNIHAPCQEGVVQEDPSKIMDKPGYMINERFWQVIGSGGVLVQQYHPQIAEFFDEDRVIMAKDKKDFQDKCKYYRAHIDDGLDFYHDLKEEIKAKHSYKQRCQRILDSL